MKELQFFLLNSHMSARQFALSAGINYEHLIKIKNGAKCSEAMRERILEVIAELQE